MTMTMASAISGWNFPHQLAVTTDQLVLSTSAGTDERARFRPALHCGLRAPRDVLSIDFFRGDFGRRECN